MRIVVLVYGKDGQLMLVYGPFHDDGGANALITRMSALFPERRYVKFPIVSA